MSFNGQPILPAIRAMKDFEKMLSMNYEYGVFLDLHMRIGYARVSTDDQALDLQPMHLNVRSAVKSARSTQAAKRLFAWRSAQETRDQRYPANQDTNAGRQVAGAGYCRQIRRLAINALSKCSQARRAQGTQDPHPRDTARAS